MFRRSTVVHDPFSVLSTQSRLILVLCGVGFIVTCHVLWIDEPFDSSLGGLTSGEYYGYASRAFDSHGIYGLRISPALFFQENNAATIFPYYHHPPAPHLLIYPCYRMFGRNEQALRVPILGLLVTSLLLMWLLARRVAGGGTAAVALIVFCSTPLVIQYGNMVDAPTFSVTFLIAGAFCWIGWRDKPTRARYAAFFVVGFLGAMSDWFGYFLVLGAWFDLVAFQPGSKRIWRQAFLAGLPFGVGLLTYILWLIWAHGDFVAGIRQFALLLEVPTGLNAVRDNSGYEATQSLYYMEQMKHWSVRGYGPVLLLTTFTGILIATWRWLIRRATRLDRLGLLLLVAGILPSAVFRDRAATHEFWILCTAPASALLTASALGTLVSQFFSERRHQVPAIMATITVLGVFLLPASRGVAMHNEYRTDAYRQRGEALNGYFEPDDVIIMPGVVGSVRYYCRASIVPEVHTKARFAEAVKLLRPGREDIGRIFLVIPTNRIREFLRSWDPVNLSYDDIPLLPGSTEIEYGPDTRVAVAQIDMERFFGDD